MARALPIGSELTVVNPAFSALAALGLEEAVVSMGPADGASQADAPESMVSAPPSYEELENAGSAFAVPPAILEPGEVVDRASDDVMLVPTEMADTAPTDPLAGLILIPFEFSAAAQPLLAIEARPEWSFLDVRTVVEFHTEGLGAPATGAESAPVFDGASSAQSGRGGGGGGGGSGGSGGVLTQYHSGSPDDAGYDILIQFKGTAWTVTLQDAFKKAADYFTTVITEDIGGPGRIGKVIVDDLYVTAEVKTIDGVGNILGQAGPTSVWTSSELTAAGQMQFDVADASNYLSLGLWDDIVTHELMHVLGFGSLWNYGANPLVFGGNEYRGVEAVAAYSQAKGSTQAFIPVETDGGSGTAGAHWDDATLGSELMTGYINSSGNYLSKFSVMSLADLGYKVNYFDYPHDQVVIT